jgi:hypothetical protein
MWLALGRTMARFDLVLQLRLHHVDREDGTCADGSRDASDAKFGHQRDFFWFLLRPLHWLNG